MEYVLYVQRFVIEQVLYIQRSLLKYALIFQGSAMESSVYSDVCYGICVLFQRVWAGMFCMLIVYVCCIFQRSMIKWGLFQRSVMSVMECVVWSEFRCGMCFVFSGVYDEFWFVFSEFCDGMCCMYGGLIYDVLYFQRCVMENTLCFQRFGMEYAVCSEFLYGIVYLYFQMSMTKCVLCFQRSVMECAVCSEV